MLELEKSHTNNKIFQLFSTKSRK